MFQCHICGSKESRQGVITQMLQTKNRPVMIENVPATVCVQCGEAVLDIAIVEQIRRMIHGQARPVKTVMTDVFEFA